MAELFANNFTTTLAGNGGTISGGATTINVAAPAPTALQTAGGQFRVVVDGEIMIVTGGASGTAWTVTRGAEGTIAVAHNDGAIVAHTLTAASVQAASPGVSVSWQSAGQIPGVVENMVRGRAILAGHIAGAANGLGTTGPTTRAKYVLSSACADLRLLYDANFANDQGKGPNNDLWIKASIELTVPFTTLNTPLSTGSPITSMTVASTPDNALPATTPITITSGGNSQQFSLSAANTPNGGTLAVTSLTPNFAYPVGSIITATVQIPVTFGGATWGILDNSGNLLSDPCPVEVTAGQAIYVRSFQRVPFTDGTGYLQLAAAVTIGGTSVTTTAAPTGAMPQTITLDTGGNAETVTISSWSGTANPFTLNLKPGTSLAKNHALAATLGQGGFANLSLLGDLGEANTASNGTDFTAAGIFSANQQLAQSTTTTTAIINAGDSKFTCVAPVPGATVTVDTGGSPEVVTVANWQGTANPYTCYISGTFASGHASGVTVQASTYTGNGLGPAAIVADRITGARNKSVLLIGDSIPAGTGYSERTSSYLFDALTTAGYPFLPITQSGESAYQFNSPWGSQLRRRRLALCDWAYYEYGTNDAWGGVSLASMQATAQAIWSALKQRGIKVCAQTLIPRTTSTDNWATTTNQTISGFNAVRVAYNDWLRNFASNGLQGAYIDAVMDMANVLEVNAAGTLTQNGGYWATNGMTINSFTGPFTADGIHPSWNGHRAMAAAITPASIFV